MSLDELITDFFNQSKGDEDYLYQEYREQQMEQQEQERLAYEEMLGDKY